MATLRPVVLSSASCTNPNVPEFRSLTCTSKVTREAAQAVSTGGGLKAAQVRAARPPPLLPRPHLLVLWVVVQRLWLSCCCQAARRHGALQGEAGRRTRRGRCPAGRRPAAAASAVGPCAGSLRPQATLHAATPQPGRTWQRAEAPLPGQGVGRSRRRLGVRDCARQRHRHGRQRAARWQQPEARGSGAGPRGRPPGACWALSALRKTCRRQSARTAVNRAPCGSRAPRACRKGSQLPAAG